ncbi:MAG: response regulator [Phaeodactylibacter sp.]|nr:response regulator [Phaeodactylibacter sp.]
MKRSPILIETLLATLGLFLSVTAAAQAGSQEKGSPLIRNFSPEEYHSDITCTSLIQGFSGMVYVANERGVLEYDGAEWRLIQTPIGQDVRALEQTADGTIYTGGLKNIGYLSPDENGLLQFHSLIDELPEGQRNFGFFREAIAIEDTVYLRGEQLLVKLAGRRVLQTWKVNGWRGLFHINGALYVDQLNPGLCRLEKGQIKLVPGGERFVRTHVYVMLPLGEDILIGTMDQGLFRYNPRRKGAEAFQTFPSELNEYFLEHQCYSGLALPDGRLALGTFTGGMVIMDALGRQRQLFHEFPGYSVRVVEGMMADRQGALWFTSENGVSRMEIHLPISFWGKEKGLSSRLTSISRFAGYLFIASYNGLMQFDPREYPTAPFRQFGQLGKIINPLSLLSTPPIDGKERLIIGGSSGLGEVALDNDGQWQTQLVNSEQNSAFLYHFAAYPRRLYVLNRANNEVRTLRLEQGRWVEDGRQTADGPTFLGAGQDGRVWAGTYSRGMALLTLDEEGRLLNQPPSYYGPDKGLPSAKYTMPLPLSDGLYFLAGDSAYRYLPGEDRFEPAVEANAWMDALGANYLHPDNNGNLLLTRQKDGLYLPLGIAFLESPGLPPEQAYQLDTTFHNRLPETITSIYSDADSVLWIGTTKGLFRYNRRHAIDVTYPLTVYIRKVTVAGQDSVLFGGAPLATGGQKQYFSLANPLSYRLNNLHFRFAAQGYDDPQKNQYRYFLEGFDRKWSNWAGAPQKEYTNLPEGEYTFRVMARDIYGNVSPEASFRFSVAPPWWRTPFTYLGMSLLLMLAMWSWVRYRTRRDRQKLARQKAQLEKERQLNERLRHVDRLKDQFLANTSHELRTPLHGIIGLAESLEGREGDPDKLEDIQMIISSGKRLSSLVNDILDFSRLKNHEIELQPKPVDMHALVDVILRIHAPLARGKDLELKNRVPLRGSIVWGDENRLMQVMHNLVGNGIKFSESGHIRVSARRTGERLEVSVEDTGVGIPPEKKEAIFQEFEQADGSEKRLFTGTGLGLSVSKRLIEMHGGQLWVESEEGRGSTFNFTLPLSREKLAPDMAPPEPASRPEERPRSASKARPLQPLPPLLQKDSDKIRILIVDDEPINQRVLANHLRSEQFQIISAMNGREALEAISSSDEPFDLVLLDVMMPSMSGYEVCQKIRERHLPSELPVIMVTAKNQVSDLVEGLAVGANDYLAKPFTKEEFLARVKTHLYLHRINSATGKFVPYEFLQALGREAITEVRLGDQALREVTVFFSDIRGYTALSETMNPTDNFRFVNALNGRLGPYIRSNHGFINQYLGDAIMAIFPQEPMNALAAAIQMQEALQEYNRYRQKKQRSPIRLGMGIHTGPLIMGIIGDNKRMDAATIADTVNTASRVESLTKYYGANILLTDESLERIPKQEGYLLRYLGKVQVIGKKKALGLYECFNGDEPRQREQKQESLPEFRKAVAAYFNKEFWDAGHLFEELLHRYPQDGAVRFFLNEARHLASEGAPTGWTGVVEMRSK